MSVSAQVMDDPEGSASGFKARLINIEAASNETFRYSTTLYNASKESLVYELKADLPSGWLATFRAEGSQVTSLRIDPKSKHEVVVELMLHLQQSRASIVSL